MLVASDISLRFGARYLFENVTVKFSVGNRYGLIGANGSGKSTFMKILSGEIAPTTGSVSKDPYERIAVLSQNQFAFDEFLVIEMSKCSSILQPRLQQTSPRFVQDSGRNRQDSEQFSAHPRAPGV